MKLNATCFVPSSYLVYLDIVNNHFHLSCFSFLFIIYKIVYFIFIYVYYIFIYLLFYFADYLAETEETTTRPFGQPLVLLNENGDPPPSILKAQASIRKK